MSLKDQRLPLKPTMHAVLSLVAQRRTYGYMLDREFSGWPLSGPTVPRQSAIFKSLAELNEDGLITSADPPADAPPPRSGRDRRYYEVTEAGQRQVTEWMETEPESLEELWLRIGSARPQDVRALIRWVKKAEGECLDRLEQLSAPDLQELVAGGAHFRLIMRAILDSVEISQVEERSRLLREIRRVLSQAAQDDPPKQ